MSADSIAELKRSIGTLAKRVDPAPLVRAARKAADAANSEYTRAHVPVRAVVTVSGQGARVSLVQTGPFTKRFAAMDPVQMLRKCVQDALPTAGKEIVDSIAGEFH